MNRSNATPLAEQATLTLAEINASNIPSHDKWQITDTVAAAQDFAGLRQALQSLDGTQRAIEIEFTELTSLPDFAIFGSDDLEYLCKHFAHNGTPTEPHHLVRNLTKISAPAATRVGQYALYACVDITAIDLPQATTLEQNALHHCHSLTTIDAPEVRRIASCALSDCDTLSSIAFENVTTISADAFTCCINLTEVKLPKATTIGDGAFSACPALTHVELPSATHLGEYLFGDCNSLREVAIATNEDIEMVSIHPNAFASLDTSMVKFMFRG